MKGLNYLMEKINYKIENKLENRITFNIKNGYYLERLTLETIKLFGSTKSKITKDKNGENVSHLKINEAAFIHCKLLTTTIRKIQGSCNICF